MSDILEKFQELFSKAVSLHQQGKFQESNDILFSIEKYTQDSTFFCIIAQNLLCLYGGKKSLEYITQQQITLDNSFANTTFGDIYLALDRDNIAYDYYQKALQISPQDTHAINKLLNYYMKIQDRDKIFYYLNKSLSIDNKQVELLKQLALVEGDRGDLKRTIEIYSFLLSFSKEVDIYHFLALAYLNTGDYKSAIEYFLLSLQEYKNDKSILICYYNLGTSYHKLGFYKEAKKYYNLYLAIDMNCAKVNWSLSVIYLLHGDFYNGWRKYEWRKKLDNYNNSTHGLMRDTPKYNGEDLTKKTLSIHSEQGFGDTIQFARFVTFVLENTQVEHIVFRIHTVLYELFSHFNNDRCTLYKEGFSHIKGVRADYQIELISIASIFRINPFDLNNKAYVFAKHKIDFLKKNKKLNIGLAWAGNPENSNNKHRSLKLKQLEEILNLNANFYSLHLEELAYEIEQNNYQDKVENLSSKINSFCDSASIVSQLDLVISVDTVIAHLSGALGVKTYILLQYSPDFRWLLDRNDSPWYESVELFRQQSFDDYKLPINKIKERLEEDILRENSENK